MIECRYRIGDVLITTLMVVFWISLSVQKAITEHWAWAIPGGVIVLLYTSGALLNKRDRGKDKVRQIREARQIALGVPPDKVS